MTAFEQLGIEPGATPAEIKRAYARAIKRHRPDTDPAGFQAMTDAYQACLAWVDEPEWEFDLEADDARIDADAPQAPSASDDTSFADDDAATGGDGSGFSAPEGFDLPGFLDELATRAQRDTPAALGDWLRGIEAFYALSTKAAVTDAVVFRLAQLDPPLRTVPLETVLAFFNVDSVNQPRFWIAGPLLQLRSLAEGAGRLQSMLDFYRSRQATPVDRLLAREVLGPRNRWRSALIALVPGLPARTRALQVEFVAAGREYADRSIDRATETLWENVTDTTRFHPQRLAMLVARLVALFGLFSVFGVEAAGVVAAVATGLWAVRAAWHWVPAAWTRRTGVALDIDGESVVLLLVAAGTGVALVTGHLVVLAWIALIHGFVYAARIRDENGPVRGVVPALFLAALVFAIALGSALGGQAIYTTIAVCLPAALAATVVLDELHARRRGEPLDAVRRGPGWVGHAAACVGATAVAVLVATSGLLPVTGVEAVPVVAAVAAGLWAAWHVLPGLWRRRTGAVSSIDGESVALSLVAVGAGVAFAFDRLAMLAWIALVLAFVQAARIRDKGGAVRAAVPGLVLAALVFAVALGAALGGTAIYTAIRVCLPAALMATVVLDELQSRLRGVPLATVRRSAGWLGYAATCVGWAALVVLVAGAALRMGS